MRVIGFDLETTTQPAEGVIDLRKGDPSPYNPLNKIVSVHWRVAVDGVIGPAQRAIMYHAEIDEPEATSFKLFLEDLQTADLVIAHNAKFDVSWLRAVGVEVEPETYCTMIGEYIFARGQKGILFSLEASAERRDVTRKKSDLTKDLFKAGVGFDTMPLDTVIEYADADVLSCLELYFKQTEELAHEANVGLTPVFDLMNDMMHFLVEIESNGAFVHQATLDQVHKDFLAEKVQIHSKLEDIVASVMGDTPISLSSPQDLSTVIYSRKFKDKEAKGYHYRAFNCGLDAKGKPKYAPKMSDSKFANTVRKSTRVAKKTSAEHCNTCEGKGYFYKYKANGERWKKSTKCPACEGRGYLLIDTGVIAGLRLTPAGPRAVSANGFKTDKDTIGVLLSQAYAKDNLEAVEFLTNIRRLNAVESYLSSFIGGVNKNTRWETGLLHTSFKQTVTATGRLSSAAPNMQNLPKGNKLPIRKAIISRWPGGSILEADYSGLEFAVAGDLSGDEQIISDINNKKDTHKQTATIINQCALEDVTKDMRQGAKEYTFAPLYGGTGAQEPPHIQAYFGEFFNIYVGLKRWHTELTNAAVETGIIRIPSGREYYFPNVRRLNKDRVSNQTNIVNYPCQGFATGDIVPLACVRALRGFRAAQLKSKLILTVHDSVVVDVYPGELDEVIRVTAVAMEGVIGEIKERFNYSMSVPLAIEMENGVSWMEQELVYKT